MYQRVLRSLEYVKSLPEWDGKRLIVMGASQGGAQSIVAAALDPDVTLCVANVPALCDHPGDLLSRKAGWPQFYKCKNGKLSNPETAHELEYYDTIHFASRINCETYFATGLIDFICPPCSVISAFNKMPSKTKKDIEVQPSAGHNALSIAGEKRIREIVALRK
jgi:cephalosporin-C deacetylase-like acetyl esterase